MTRRNIVAEVMAEHCLYGGLLATRAQVHEDLCRWFESKGHDPKRHFLHIDRMIWMYPSVDDEQADALRARGMVFEPDKDEPQTQG